MLTDRELTFLFAATEAGIAFPTEKVGQSIGMGKPEADSILAALANQGIFQQYKSRPIVPANRAKAVVPASNAPAPQNLWTFTDEGQAFARDHYKRKAFKAVHWTVKQCAFLKPAYEAANGEPFGKPKAFDPEARLIPAKLKREELWDILRQLVDRGVFEGGRAPSQGCLFTSNGYEEADRVFNPLYDEIVPEGHNASQQLEQIAHFQKAQQTPDLPCGFDRKTGLYSPETEALRRVAEAAEKQSASRLSPFEQSCIDWLSTLPTTWTRLKWEELSSVDEQAIDRLIESGLAEVRANVELKPHGGEDPFTARARISGDWRPNLLPEVLKSKPEWTNEDGRLKIGIEFVFDYDEIRLTNEGAIALADLKQKEGTYVLSFLRIKTKAKCVARIERKPTANQAPAMDERSAKLNRWREEAPKLLLWIDNKVGGSEREWVDPYLYAQESGLSIDDIEGILDHHLYADGLVRGVPRVIDLSEPYRPKKDVPAEREVCLTEKGKNEAKRLREWQPQKVRGYVPPAIIHQYVMPPPPQPEKRPSARKRFSTFCGHPAIAPLIVLLVTSLLVVVVYKFWKIDIREPLKPVATRPVNT